MDIYNDTFLTAWFNGVHEFLCIISLIPQEMLVATHFKFSFIKETIIKIKDEILLF